MTDQRWHFVGDATELKRVFVVTPDQVLELMQRAFDWNGRYIPEQWDEWIEQVSDQLTGATSD